jgi:hypothetical protein
VLAWPGNLQLIPTTAMASGKFPPSRRNSGEADCNLVPFLIFFEKFKPRAAIAHPFNIKIDLNLLNYFYYNLIQRKKKNNL